MDRPLKLGLVLSGGGPAGAFEVGVVGAIEEAGLTPTILSGTSAGAVNAAALATGLGAAHLTDLWLGLRDEDVYHLRLDVWNSVRLPALFSLRPDNAAEWLLSAAGWTWLLDSDPLRRTLVRTLGGESLAVRPGVVLAVSAVEIPSGELVRFVSSPPAPARRTPAYRTVDFTVDHLLASAAVPLLFKPARVGGVPYWDGGIIANTPLAPVFAYEPDAIIVVVASAVPRPAREPRSLGQAIALLLHTVIGFSLRNDLEHARTVNLLAQHASGATDRRFVDLLVVEPPPGEPGLELDIGLDMAETARLIALGRHCGRAALERWLASRDRP